MRVFTVEYQTYDEKEAEEVYNLLEFFLEKSDSAKVIQRSEEDDPENPLECPTLIISDHGDSDEPQ